MSKLLELLQMFLNEQRIFAAMLGGMQVVVQVRRITGDVVTLVAPETGDRFDLHYTEVIILSKVQVQSGSPHAAISLAITDHLPLPEKSNKSAKAAGDKK